MLNHKYFSIPIGNNVVEQRERTWNTILFPFLDSK